MWGAGFFAVHWPPDPGDVRLAGGGAARGARRLARAGAASLTRKEGGCGDALAKEHTPSAGLTLLTSESLSCACALPVESLPRLACF